MPLRQNYQGGRNHEEALHTHHLTALALTLGLSVSAAAAGPASTAPDDLDSYLLAHTTVSEGARSLPIDRSEVNEHAITGYYTYTFQDGDAAGRTFKLYAGRHAALRAISP
mgnify:CR=1 FL=1